MKTAPFKKTLRTTLRTLAAVTLLAFNSIARAQDYRPAEPFTSEEIALVKSLFGDSIRTNGLQKRFVRQGLHFNEAAFVKHSDTSSVFIRGRDRYSPNYATDTSIVLREYFIHEVMHIVQLQRRGARMRQYGLEDPSAIRGVYDDYLYGVGRDSKFTRYTPEQQAAITQDYMLRFCCDTPQPTRWLSMLARDTPHRDTWLAKVFEDEFPAARANRLKREAAMQNRKGAPKPPGGT